MKILLKIVTIVLLLSSLVNLSPVIAAGTQQDYTLNLSGGVARDWSVEMGQGFNVTNSTLKNSWDSDATRITTFIYAAVQWSQRYTYKVDVLNEGGDTSNYIRIIFNYKNSNNFYYVRFGGNSTNGAPELRKVVEGSDVLIKNYPSNFSVKQTTTLEITYDNGKISVTGKKAADPQPTVLFSDVADPDHTAGRIGIGTYQSVGIFSNISVSGIGTDALLKFESASPNNGDLNVPLLPDVKLNFNLPLRSSTVTKTSVKVKKGSADMAQGDYNVSVENQKTIALSFNKPLDYKTPYAVIVTKDVKSDDFGGGLLAEYQLNFTTKPQAFDVESATVVSLSGTDITGNIFSYGGQSVKLKITARNNDMASEQPYVITAALVNPNGLMIFSKSFKGTVNLGGLVSIDETIIIPEQVVYPSASAEGTKLEVFTASSFEDMKKLHKVTAIPFSDFNFITITPDLNGTVTISGKLPSGEADRTISIAVLNPNKTLNDITTDGSALQKQAEIKTGQNGVFNFAFSTFLTEDSVSGRYKVYIGGDDFSARDLPSDLSYYYALPKDREDAVVDINTTTDNGLMQAILESNKDILSYNFPPFNAITKGDLTEKLIKEAERKELTDLEIRSFVMKHSIIEAYNQSKNTAVLSLNGEFLYDDILELSKIDQTRQLTVYGFYGNSLTSVGKEKVRSGMFGNSFLDISDLHFKFAEQVVVHGINNCKISGYGHIKDLVTINGSAAGLNLTSYNSDNADRKLVTKTIDTKAKLQEYINELSVPDTVITPPPPSGGGGGGGGGGTVKSFSVIGEVEAIEAPVLTEKPKTSITLLDMEGVEWGLPSVLNLIEKKVVSEPPDGNFRPNDYVTREEFVKMIVASLNMELSKYEELFDDVDENDFFAPYICAAKKASIINGLDENTFGGKENVSRQDVAVIIYRAFKSDLITLESEMLFEDSDEIAEYASESVNALTALSIINGVGSNRFAPSEHCTRVQAAKIISGVLNLKGVAK